MCGEDLGPDPGAEQHLAEGPEQLVGRPVEYFADAVVGKHGLTDSLVEGSCRACRFSGSASIGPDAARQVAIVAARRRSPAEASRSGWSTIGRGGRVTGKCVAVQRTLVGIGGPGCGPRAYKPTAVGPPAQPHRAVGEKRFGEFAEHDCFSGTADRFSSTAGGYRCRFEEASAGGRVNLIWPHLLL